jgi:N-methylhydantoinase A
VSLRIGVDIGGTFTDVALLDDARGRLTLFKLPTTPEDPSVAALAGIEAILANAGARAGDVTSVGHGTTVGTNAILEGRTARVGLITTAGFRDLLDIARQRRPRTYDMTVDRAHPLVLRRHRRELVERVRYDGSVAVPLDLGPLPDILERFGREAIEAIAVCFLHAYANPAHEREVERAIAATGRTIPISLSSEVAPEFREYERFSTTVINAALVPLMRSYLRNFESSVRACGIPGTTYLSQSSGGVTTLEAGGKLPAATLFSGPAAGVTGAIAVARQAGFDDLLTFDMGGTSTDVCLVRGGEAVIATMREVEGHTVRTAAVDVHSVGAGGGSAASLDAGGFLRVGPRSVGAVPGPVCYGRGGTTPAVTDANLALGRLNPAGLLAGRVPLYLDRAAEALRASVGAPKGLTAIEVARGVLEVVNSNMVRALRVVSVERGWDPRDFTLVAFGGAGPLHACDLARDLDVRRVLVPPAPGILCAIGLLVADLRSDASRTYLRSAASVSSAEVNAWFGDVRAQAERAMVVPEGTKVEELRWLDMRYAGQNYELRVSVRIGPLNDEDLALVVKRFHEAHRRRHGYEVPEADVQLVNLRVALRVPPQPLPPLSRPEATRAPSPAATREVFFAEVGRFIRTPIYQRATLPIGFAVAGPLVVEQMDSMVIVPPDVKGHVDDWGNLVLELA